MKKKSSRIGKIELLRFLFCVLILLYHTGKDNKARGWMFTKSLSFFNKGFIGVDFFFLVTGYVTAAAIYRSLQASSHDPALASPSTGQRTWSFLWKKISSILPFHIVIAAVTFLYRLATTNRGFAEMIVKGLPSLFFVQMSGYASHSFIGVEWYISSMLLALLIIYPLCYTHYDLYTHIIAPGAGFLLSGFMIMSMGTFGNDGALNILVTNGNVRAFAHISLGIFVFELVRTLHDRFGESLSTGRQILFLALEVLSYLGVVYTAMGKGYTRTWMGSMLLLMLIGVTVSFTGYAWGQELFNNRLCYFLGRASLPIYLCQNLWRSIAKRYVSTAPSAVVILFTAGGTILLGFLLQAAYDFWKAGKNKNE